MVVVYAPPGTPPHQPADDTFALAAADVGNALAGAIQDVLAGLAERLRGPQQLAEQLNVDKGFASRLLKAIRSRNGLAVLHRIPGPEPLRRLVRAAARRGAQTGAVRAADGAIAAFERMIDSAGDRSTFDGIVGALAPEARRPVESRAKQLLFRGFSQLRGFAVDVDFTTAVIHPAGDGQHVDYGVLTGMLGLRRLRPGAIVRLATFMMFAERPPWALTTLDGKPIECLTAGRLDQFCTMPAALEVQRGGDVLTYTLAGDDFQSQVDLVLGQLSRNTAPLWSPPGERRMTGVGHEVDKPTRRLQLDVYVHESVYPGVAPRLFQIDTTFRGVANINDPARRGDHWALTEEIEPLGTDPGARRSSHVPRYLDMLEFLFRGTGWPSAGYRGYRCAIEYPVYGTQVTMGFERPPAP